MHRAAEESDFRERLQADRALIFVHTSWSAYSFRVQAGLEEWERLWDASQKSRVIEVLEVEPDEQPFVREWLEHSANEQIYAIERAAGFPDRWATGTGKAGDYASLGSGPLVLLRAGLVVDFVGAPEDLLTDPSRRKELDRRVHDALWPVDSEPP